MKTYILLAIAPELIVAALSAGCVHHPTSPPSLPQLPPTMVVEPAAVKIESYPCGQTVEVHVDQMDLQLGAASAEVVNLKDETLHLQGATIKMSQLCQGGK